MPAGTGVLPAVPAHGGHHGSTPKCSPHAPQPRQLGARQQEWAKGGGGGGILKEEGGGARTRNRLDLRLMLMPRAIQADHRFR